jgi:hypothetical protein
MSAERTNFVTVFRTGNLVYLDWASNALEAAGIPFQRREETSGGLTVAMPAAPSSFPGTWWSIVVPEESLSRGQQVLAELPFEKTTNPGIWDFQPKAGGKTGWRIYAAVVLTIMVLTAVVWILRIAQALR